VVLDAYGGVCRCCGEDEFAFLALDHVNGGGRADRAARGGADWWSSLIREGFPSGYQVLCHNCNTAKERPGGCPHATNGRLLTADVVAADLRRRDTVMRLTATCTRGHEMSGDNVRISQQTGKRTCRTCVRENSRNYKERQALARNVYSS
jgi:hypothetical protein